MLISERSVFNAEGKSAKALWQEFDHMFKQNKEINVSGAE